MPPKTFVCEICGQANLTKPKSYAYKKGRACRIHQEAVDAKSEYDKSIEKQKSEYLARQKRFEEKRNSWNKPFDFTLRCIGCDRSGMPAKEFFFRQILSLDMAELLHGRKINPFLSESVVKGVAPEKIPLFTIELPKDAWRLVHKKHEVFLELTNGLCHCCHECIDLLKLPDPMPRPDFDTLVTFAAIAEASGLRDHQRNIAKQVLDLICNDSDGLEKDNGN